MLRRTLTCQPQSWLSKFSAMKTSSASTSRRRIQARLLGERSQSRLHLRLLRLPQWAAMELAEATALAESMEWDRALAQVSVDQGILEE